MTKEEKGGLGRSLGLGEEVFAFLRIFFSILQGACLLVLLE